MHQPTEFLCDVDEHIAIWHENYDKYPAFLKKVVYELSYRILEQCHEYVDDGSDDALECAELCNSEMDFIDWFVDEVFDRDYQSGKVKY